MQKCIQEIDIFDLKFRNKMEFKHIIDYTTSQYFNKTNWEQKYSINYQKEKDDKYYNINNVKYIISIISIESTSNCICGFGDNTDAIFQFKNGDFGYLFFQSSCLTFDTDGAEYTIEISDILEDLIWFCLTEKARNNFLFYLKDISAKVKLLQNYLVNDLIKLVLNYGFPYRLDTKLCKIWIYASYG